MSGPPFHSGTAHLSRVGRSVGSGHCKGQLPGGGGDQNYSGFMLIFCCVLHSVSVYAIIIIIILKNLQS